MVCKHKKYYNWICSKVATREQKRLYKKLLDKLYNTEFTYIIMMDENRAWDGQDLRKHYARHHDGNTPSFLEPCSILEMMIALAERCECTIWCRNGDEPDPGINFWEMIESLGLDNMTDDNYVEEYVDEILNVFVTRTYEPDGRGSLYTIQNPTKDMRKVEIWYQMHAHLNEIDNWDDYLN